MVFTQNVGRILVEIVLASRTHPKNLRKLGNLRQLSQVSQGRSIFLKVSIWSEFSYSRSGICIFSQGGEASLFSYDFSEFSQGRSDFLKVGKLRDLLKM